MGGTFASSAFPMPPAKAACAALFIFIAPPPAGAPPSAAAAAAPSPPPGAGIRGGAAAGGRRAVGPGTCGHRGQAPQLCAVRRGHGPRRRARLRPSQGIARAAARRRPEDVSRAPGKSVDRLSSCTVSQRHVPSRGRNTSKKQKT